MKIKRYQTWTRDGIQWSYWFPYSGDENEKWQLNNKLKNEYKEVTNEEWDRINKEQQEHRKKKYSK